ncbi:hypothetical protein [Stieleria mannarensis]|uniref:hypothetical protein n=1 Tax=Stieleria mannarensis TaxID=2755585 RepID=UPI0016013F6B|nr:hypothetical protein [Rhodopirellula sp. JC639]
MSSHSYRTLPTEGQAKTYRCKVVGDSTAKLLVGRKFQKVFVRETSGGGFTLGLSTKVAKKIKSGKSYDLRYDDRRMQVIAETFVETVQGEARLQVGTIHEYEPKERWAFRLPFSKGSRIIGHDSGIDSGAAYGGFVLVLFCVMALPGVGDRLGTAPRIESALAMMSKNIGDVVYAIRH